MIINQILRIDQDIFKRIKKNLKIYLIFKLPKFCKDRFPNFQEKLEIMKGKNPTQKIVCPKIMMIKLIN